METERKDVVSISRSLFDDSSLISLIQRHRPFICPFEKLVDQVPIGSRIMDIGCGAGLFLGLLARLGRIREGVGFDSSAPAIAAAQRMSGKVAPLGLEFHHLGVEESWPDGTFDAVSLIDVMHHVPRPMRSDLLRMATQRVRHGGVFIYKDMVRKPLWRATANRLHDLIQARQWINYEPIASVEATCRSKGLELIHQDRVNMLWYGHELRVFRRPR
jgi:2-polyprenyl-3-methyl-5-hydroxy-6-metoxy-1,4-benzoquinol methylase